MYKGVLLGHPLMSQCNKFLNRHKPLTHQQWLRRIEESSELGLEIDFYNNGPAIALLEQKMANILGKEQALFVHKGMVGQHSSLLHWSSQSQYNKIAIHPQSHMQLDEELAYQKLLGLQAVMFGKENQALNNHDINALPKDLSSICVELPLRRSGFQLPKWQDLQYLKEFSLDSKIPLHIDGARLFEAACYWNKPYKELASLGDSVYVSLYKTLGAAAGGIVAGDSKVIQQLKPWRTRLGGDLPTAFPYVLTALWGLENYLPRVPEFYQRACELSTLIISRLGQEAIPNPVQSNGFLVELAIDAKTLEDRALELAETRKIWLFDRIMPVGDNRCRFELQVGDALDDWQNCEPVDLLESLL